jgi:hypothetical protein
MAGRLLQLALIGPLALHALLGSGCAFQGHRKELEKLHALGEYEEAAYLLDDPEIQSLYGENNRVLWELDRGAVALALDNQDKAIAELEAAEIEIDRRFEQSTGDVIAQWALNDTAAAYMPGAYEDIYVNVLKLLAQLEAGRIDGYATVEARRAATKANRLRDRYLGVREELGNDTRIADAEGSIPSMARVNEEGEFIESTLGTYLTAVTFMESGDYELQGVAGRRLLESIDLQSGLIGWIDPEPFQDLGYRRPETSDVLIVALSGRGPVREAERIGPILLYTVPVYMELPVLVSQPSEVESAHVEIEGLGMRPLDLVEDLAAVAEENHRRQLPMIYTRTFVRASAKAAASAVTTGALRGASDGADKGWVTLAAVLGGLIFVTITEEADLRSWVFLPGQAHVTLLDLEPGVHRVRVVYKDRRGGIVYTSPWRTVHASDSGLDTVVEHYWR